MFMLHKMSEIRGWKHDEMMNMPKRVFYRYYGYWYQDRLMEAEEHEKTERESKADNRPKNWKPI